jgi:hypothetical protein
LLEQFNQSIFTANSAQISHTLFQDNHGLDENSATPHGVGQEGSWLTRKYCVSINSRLIDKIKPKEEGDYASGFTSQSLTISELAEQIGKGFAYGSHYKNDYRNSLNFHATDIVSVDIDEGMTVDQALDHELVQQAATLLYTTASHTSEAHRFRIIFGLPRTITNAAEFRAVMRSLALQFNGDNSVVDPGRMFFGSRKAEFHLFDRGLDEQLLAELIEQSINQVKNVSTKDKGKRSITSRLRIASDLMITAASGVVAPSMKSPQRPVSFVHFTQTIILVPSSLKAEWATSVFIVQLVKTHFGPKTSPMISIASNARRKRQRG